jgi:hypothetical protein
MSLPYTEIITEAERFIKKAREAQKAIENSEQSYYLHPKETGAAKRASMDLTRALAEFRRP